MLRVILWKHFVVRTNKISSTILTILELLVPILTFLLIIYTKSELGTFDKVFVNESTYLRPISNEELLTRINIASTNILYTPDTEFVADLVREAQLKLNMYNENIKRFPTKEKLIDYYNTYDHEGPVVVIIFNNAGYKIPQHLDYEIKIYEEGILWHTDKLFSDVFTYVPGIGSESYLEKAFAAVQVALDTSFIEMASKSMFNTSLTYQEYPYPPHLNTDGVTTSFQYILPFITIITFIFICPITLKRIVLEKSSGLKELLKIAGVQSWTLWFGWFLNGIILNAISVIGIAIIITQPLFSGTYPVIEHCNVVVLMLFLLLYCSATIAFFLAFSVFFNKATLAMVLGVLFWIISYIVFVGVAANVEVMSITIKGIFLLFPTIALYYGYNTISLFEMREADITFYNLHESPTTSYDDLSLGFVMLMLAFDTVLYVTLAVYFDKIWPGPYGISKPWNFLLNKVWKMFRKNEVVHKPEDYLLPSIEVANLKTIMQLRNVTKVYDNTVAVCDLTMDIYEGSITGLLGENGAGKSTTMSMLTGLTKATSGQIYIDSCAINENVDVARKNVAICTQHDLLYEELTVMDHLILFGMLKGKSRRRAREQATHLLEQTLKLDNKANKFVSELSGGMKRKLSLGIALMGDPKILILDEPTSGIDVEGRREIWDLILSFKGKKTVLISTHFLEEAEYLSDYIAIMGVGCLICFGTPIGLKKQYDIGYKCTITYQDTSKYPDIRKLLQKFTGFDSIDKKEDNTIQCRFKEGSKNEIIRLLHELDDAKGKCKLTYKLSSNTLEDVYLKVQDKGRTPRQIDHTETERTLPSSWVKIRIFMRKRSLFLQKKWMQYLCLFLLAFAVFLFTFTLGNTGYADVSKDGTKIRLDLSLYGRTDVYYRISGANQDPKLNEYYNNLVTSAGSSPNKVENVSETIIAKGLENIAHYMKRMIIAAEFVFDDDNRLSAVNVLHANKAYHGAPISINTAMNALLKYYAGKNYSISASYTPLHAHNQEKQALTQSEFSNLFLWLTLLPIGPLLLLSAVLLVPTVEYAKSTRSLDKLFGYGTCEHWLNNGAWDLIHYIISISVILLLIFVIPIHYLDAPSGGTLYLYLTMYGIFSIPFAYTFTFTKTVEGAYAKFLIIHIIGAPIMAGIFLALEAADAIANFAMWKTVVFVLEPHVSLCSALANFSIKMITNHNWDIMPVSKKQFLCSENFVQNPCCAAESKECAEYRRILDGDFLAHLAISFIIYASILIMRDCVGGLFSNDIFKRLLCCYKTESETNEGDYIFSVKDVSKEYTKLQLFGGNSYSSKHGLFSVTHALKNLTLQLDKGKCLGLLGVNGAGKTTSFRILTKQINPSGGKIKYPEGNSPTMGYCPQHNALLDEFTARELLHMYGTLRQIKNIEDVVKKLLDKFDLTLIADKPSGTYSGGSKRKLATCISIIGFPKCILLDEPTSGVDSVSRRELWDIIGQIKQRKESGIILTSHSMDECEELCDTLCILKDGDVEANSPIADLKRKYCVGHVLNIKLKSNGKRKHEGRSGEQSNSGWEETDQTDGSINITRYLIDIFERKNVTVLGTHNAVMHIKIINSEWATIFEEIEKMDKKVFNIDDYWVKEASLEEVLMQVGKSDNSLKKSNIV